MSMTADRRFSISRRHSIPADRTSAGISPSGPTWTTSSFSPSVTKSPSRSSTMIGVVRPSCSSSTRSR
jgi:hypothetical protein